MTPIEKFETIDQFTQFYRSVHDQLIPVDPFIYYMLHRSNRFGDLNPIDTLREHYAAPSDASMVEIKNLTRTAFLQSQEIPMPLPTSIEDIDDNLRLLRVNDPLDFSNHSLYLYPWPSARFTTTFFSELLPSYTRHYCAALTNAGFLRFKKSYTIVVDRPIPADFEAQLFHDDLSLLQQIDFTQVLVDLQDNLQMYRKWYSDLHQDNLALHQVIDTMSQQVTNQTLTRWY